MTVVRGVTTVLDEGRDRAGCEHLAVRPLLLKRDLIYGVIGSLMAGPGSHRWWGRLVPSGTKKLGPGRQNSGGRGTKAAAGGGGPQERPFMAAARRWGSS